jgi:hypothetical protein
MERQSGRPGRETFMWYPTYFVSERLPICRGPAASVQPHQPAEIGVGGLYNSDYNDLRIPRVELDLSWVASRLH